MPRAIWSGSISFGLVNVPVKMYSAIHEQDLSFHRFSGSKSRAGKGAGKRSRSPAGRKSA